MFDFIKNKIKKVYSSVTQKISSIFSRGSLDEQFLKELSDLLITCDTGVKTTHEIINILSKNIKNSLITSLEQAKQELKKLLINHLNVAPVMDASPRIVLLVGVNGSGKTTFIAKYANLLKGQGHKILIVAGDTFRAAATQQLCEWANRIGVEVHVGRDEQDPSAVIFDACKRFVDEKFDKLIIDTAGRLQTKVNLMKELEKMKRIVQKHLPQEQINTWLTIDAMLGQNSLVQAEIFHQATQVNGLVLTKLDGTGKGGIVFAITQKLQLPIVYITFGEAIEAIKLFDANEYVDGLLNE